MMKANEVQHGGTHYRDKAIQVWDFIYQNNIRYLEGNVIKYVSRWREKGGVQDLLKAKHYIEKLIEVETANPYENEIGTKDPVIQDKGMCTPEFHLRIVVNEWGLGHWKYVGTNKWIRTDGHELVINVGLILYRLEQYDAKHLRDESKGEWVWSH
jgi:hypothetical protein